MCSVYVLKKLYIFHNPWRGKKANKPNYNLVVHSATQNSSLNKQQRATFWKIKCKDLSWFQPSTGNGLLNGYSVSVNHIPHDLILLHDNRILVNNFLNELLSMTAESLKNKINQIAQYPAHRVMGYIESCMNRWLLLIHLNLDSVLFMSNDVWKNHQVHYKYKVYFNCINSKGKMKSYYSKADFSFHFCEILQKWKARSLEISKARPNNCVQFWGRRETCNPQ